MRRTFSAKENHEHPETSKTRLNYSAHKTKEHLTNIRMSLPEYFQVLRGVPVCSGFWNIPITT